MTTTVVNNSVFRTFFEKEKLIGPNFIDRYRNLQIVLSVKDKLTYMENPIPVVLAAHTTWVRDSKEIAGHMLMTMVLELQKNLEQRGAYDLLKELKTMFSQQTEQELLQIIRDFHACKHEEVLSLILVSLSKKYDSFVKNYNMHGMGKNVGPMCFGSVEPFNSGPTLHEMTPATISSGLVPNPPPSTPFVPPSRSDWDLLSFNRCLMNYSLLHLVLITQPPEVISPIDDVVAPEPAASTGSPSSTTVDQDAPSPS
ncbi:hypothetical protein Tco_1355594, partial [Tanacetum coccineum]